MTIGAMGRGASAVGGPAALAGAGAVAGFALLAAAIHAITPFNHDVAYFVSLAGRLLDGGRFGVDIMDINPPQVWWISAVPAWLARQAGVSLELATIAFTALMTVASLVAVDRLMVADATDGPARRLFVPLAAVLVLFAPGYDFGQREHWMVLLTLPYVVTRSMGAAGATLPLAGRAVIGIAACLGFCIKPHYLLVPIALELWLLARTRRPGLLIAPETIAVAVTGLVYAGLTVAFVPSYLKVEAVSALLGYWSYKSPAAEVLAAAATQLAPAAVLALFAVLTSRRDERIHPLAQAFAVAGVANLVAALVQLKPWPYHFLPAVLFFDLAVLTLVMSGTAREGSQVLRSAAVAILLAMGVSQTAVQLVPAVRGDDTAKRVEALTAVFRAHPGANASVFGFITSPRDVFPAVVAARMTWAAPFCCQYLVAAAVRAEEAPVADRAALLAAGREQARASVEAVRNREPGVIVIATGDDMLGFGGREFDYVAWLRANTDFADVLERYRESEPIGSFRVFVRM